MRQASLVLNVLLLIAWVHNVLVLASELVEHEIQAGLTSFLDSRSVLELLAVRVHLGSVRGGWVLLLLTRAVHVHVAKLLGSQSQELLLKLLLPLSKVQLCRQKLSSNVGVHLSVIVLHGRRGKDLVVHHWLLVVLVHAAEAVTNSGLRNAGHALPVVTVAVVTTKVVLLLTVGSRCRGQGRRGSLRGSTKTSQQVGAAGAGSRDRVLGDCSNLWRRRQAETLQSGTFATRPKTRARHADAALGLEVVVSHLSKTASVHAHCGVLKCCEQRVRLQQRGCAKHTWKDREAKMMSEIVQKPNGPTEGSVGRGSMIRRTGWIYRRLHGADDDDVGDYEITDRKDLAIK